MVVRRVVRRVRNWVGVSGEGEWNEWEVRYFVVGEVLVYHDCEVQGDLEVESLANLLCT